MPTLELNWNNLFGWLFSMTFSLLVHFFSSNSRYLILSNIFQTQMTYQAKLKGNKNNNIFNYSNKLTKKNKRTTISKTFLILCHAFFKSCNSISFHLSSYSHIHWRNSFIICLNYLFFYKHKIQNTTLKIYTVIFIF